MKKLSNHELTILDRCEAEWRWHYARGLRAGAPTAPQLLGQLVHEGVKGLYGVGGGGAPSGVPSVGTEWRVTAKLAGLLERVEAIVSGYEAQWFEGNGLDRPRRPRGLVCVWNEGLAESATEQAIPDRCVRAADGKLYAMDLKTTSMYLRPAWAKHFEHNQQVAMQLDVLEHVLGERVEGFWLDAIQLGDRSPRSAAHYERFGPMPYSDALRAELREQRVWKAMRIKQLREGAPAEKRTEACVRYNALCPYFDLCRADAGDREALVQIKLERGELKEET